MPSQLEHIRKRLSPHLQERLHLLHEAEHLHGGYILYWMKTASRAHENPALDVAVEASNLLNLPLFVSVRGGEDAWQATPSLLHFQLTLDISLNLLGGVPVWINGDEYRQDAVLSFLLGYKHS